MTAANLHATPSTAQQGPLSLLWRGDSPLDPGLSIPQNRADGAALPGAAPYVPPRDIVDVTEALSLNIWCPQAYQARLEHVLLPFGAHIAPEISADEGGAPDLAAFAADANTPSLVFFAGLSDHLATELGPQSAEAGEEALPVLPRPVPDLVKEWTGQSEALLEAVRETRGHITLIPAMALLLRPEAVAEAIAHRYGLTLGPRAEAPVEPLFVPPGQPPHFALMAGSISQTSSKVGRVLKALAEASLEVPGVDLRQPHDPAAQQRLLIEADALHRKDREAMRQSHDRDLRRVEAQAEARIQRLRHQADTARLALLERDVLSTRLSETAAQNDAAAGYLREELTRREAAYAAQTAEIDVLRAAATQLEAARKAVSVKGNRLERDVDSLTRNIQMRDDRIAGLAEALVSYEDEALALREEVAALRRSTSWRLTKPVRGVSLLLRKILRRG